MIKWFPAVDSCNLFLLAQESKAKTQLLEKNVNALKLQTQHLRSESSIKDADMQREKDKCNAFFKACKLAMETYI